MKTVPEPNAELLSAEDVHGDVASLTAALERRRAERRAYNILERPNVREMLEDAGDGGHAVAAPAHGRNWIYLEEGGHYIQGSLYLHIGVRLKYNI